MINDDRIFILPIYKRRMLMMMHNNIIIMAVVLEITPEAIGRFRFTGWLRSVSASTMSFKQ